MSLSGQGFIFHLEVNGVTSSGFLQKKGKCVLSVSVEPVEIGHSFAREEGSGHRPVESRAGLRIFVSTVDY